MAIDDSAEPAGQPGHDDVTITIRGQTAAQMLAHGDKMRELEQLVRALGQKLDGVEAAARQQAGEQARLEGLVQGLDNRLTALGGQVSDAMELRDDLARLREGGGDLAQLRDEVGGHRDKLARLQCKVEGLAMTVDGIMRRSEAENGGPASSPQPQGSAGATQGSAGISGFLTSTADRLRRLNLWSVSGALVALAAATGATLWIYA